MVLSKRSTREVKNYHILNLWQWESIGVIADTWLPGLGVWASLMCLNSYNISSVTKEHDTVNEARHKGKGAYEAYGLFWFKFALYIEHKNK